MTHDVTIDADSLRSGVRDRSITAIDVRREQDYRRGHVPAAVNLPLADLLSDENPERIRRLFGSLGIGDETHVAIYDDTFGALASRVAWTLEHMGHDPVRLLDVTYNHWRSLGLETETSEPDTAPKEHSARPRPEMLATADHLDAARQRGAVLVDNRERLNYLEQHIPGAISIPYRTLGSPDHIIRPQGEIRRLLENRAVGTHDEVITYCGSVGTLSGLAYYALRTAGLSDVRLYVRSFKEWKGLEKPVAKQEHANYWDLSAE